MVPIVAVEPMALQLSDVNLFVVTDVHSFISSHLHDDGLCGAKRCDADFGHLVSFMEHVREAADAEKKDVFMFDNGDVVDGTGLSTATKIDGSAVFPLLTALPLDALNCGNHELYQSTTVLDGLLGSNSSGRGPSFVDYWQGNYLTSNLDVASTGKPIGARYTVLRGKHGTRLLVMGWMYEMVDHCGAVNVSTIAHATAQPWFARAMAEEVDAIVVLAHMHYSDPLTIQLLAAIRKAAGDDLPVQFLTGHSHMRAWKKLDARAASFEAGHYGDTLGFASFNLTTTTARGDITSDALVEIDSPLAAYHTPATSMWFGFRYLDMTRRTLISAAGMSAHTASFDTKGGLALSARIAATRAAFGLPRVLGCASTLYRVGAPLDDPASLWALYMDHVTPATLFTPPRNGSQWFVASTGGLRYDLYQGNITVDDVDMVLPFRDTLWLIQGVRGDYLTAALTKLNSYGTPEDEARGGRRARPLRAAASRLPAYLATSVAPLADGRYYDAIFGEFDVSAVTAAVKAEWPEAPVPVRYSGTPGANAAPATDTEAWTRWASEQPQPPCEYF